MQAFKAWEIARTIAHHKWDFSGCLKVSLHDFVKVEQLEGGFSFEPTTLKPFSRRVASLRASSLLAATNSAISSSMVVMGF